MIVFATAASLLGMQACSDDSNLGGSGDGAGNVTLEVGQTDQYTMLNWLRIEPVE